MNNLLTPDRIEAAVGYHENQIKAYEQCLGLDPDNGIYKYKIECSQTALAALEVVKEWQDEKENLDQRMDAHAGRLITKCELFIKSTKDYYRKRGEDWREEADQWPLLCINDALLIIDALRAYQRQGGATQ